MALSNAERQKRCVTKNRALHNLRRRKKFAGSQSDELGRRGVAPERLPNKPAQLSKIDELRQLMEKSSKEPDQPAVQIYKDDYGRLLTERQWNTLQNRN